MYAPIAEPLSLISLAVLLTGPFNPGTPSPHCHYEACSVDQLRCVIDPEPGLVNRHSRLRTTASCIRFSLLLQDEDTKTLGLYISENCKYAVLRTI